VYGENPITKDHQPDRPLFCPCGINLKSDLVWYNYGISDLLGACLPGQGKVGRNF